MKPCVLGKNLNFREVREEDAEFIVGLRTDPALNAYLSPVDSYVEKQRAFIRNYQTSLSDYYFIITDKAGGSLGTIRIYDIQENSFCWGSWILQPDKKPKGAAIESLLMIFDYGFFGLHYAYARSDARKKNQRSVSLHALFGTTIVREDDLNFYYTYTREQYLIAREAHRYYLPE
jgi:RimJ/RimL family protein N-acetyltransferase